MNEKDLMLDVGQANELKLAARKAQYTNALLKKLSSVEMLEIIRPVLEGNADVVMKKHIIDLMAAPFIPDGWKVENHKTDKQFEFDPDKIEPYLCKSQKQGKVIEGHDLLKELTGKPVLNANVLDYLLKHPEIIPDSWKDKYIFFWGTIYRYSDGLLYVRYLYWGGGEWYWDSDWLGYDFSDDNPAALLASI